MPKNCTWVGSGRHLRRNYPDSRLLARYKGRDPGEHRVTPSLLDSSQECSSHLRVKGASYLYPYRPYIVGEFINHSRLNNLISNIN